MKTIILSAGKSTRLQPLTKNTPQSLLRVGQKTIIEKQIDGLVQADIKKEDILVITGHLSDKLEKFCSGLGVETIFDPFYDVSGIAASLWSIRSEEKKGFLFLYSDVLFDPLIVKDLLAKNGDICLALKKDNPRAEAEKVINEAGFIKEIGKTKLEMANSEFIGIAKFSSIGAEKFIKATEGLLKKSLAVSFINVVNSLIQKGEIVTACDVGNSRFVDIDFPSDLERAIKFFN